jgi:hypothetical protein
MIMILLTEDIDMLKTLSLCGVIRKEQAKKFYGDGTQRYIQRIAKLSASRMIIRDNGYVRPTLTGLRNAGIDAQPYRLENFQFEEKALAFDLASRLPDWTPTYARILKRQSQVPNPSRAGLAIERGDQKYLAYVIAENPRKDNRKKIVDEFASRDLSNFKRVLFFCTTDTIMATFTNAFKEPPDNLKEFCLLPYPQGVEFFRQAHSPELREALSKTFPGMKHATGAAYDYAVEHPRKFISVMLDNDLIKKKKLTDYVSTPDVKAKIRDGYEAYYAVCAPGQTFDIPGVKVVYDSYFSK